MSDTILQMNFSYSSSTEKLNRELASAAEELANVPGLKWKIWIMNEDRKESGGIYLFDSPRAVQSYLDSPIVGALKANDAISDVNAKSFQVLKDPTRITRGPI